MTIEVTRQCRELEGLPVFVAFDPDAKPCSAYRDAFAWLPRRLVPVFIPEKHTGYHHPDPPFNGAEVVGCWALLGQNTIEVPAGLSAGGVWTPGGHRRAWTVAWWCQVPTGPQARMPFDLWHPEHCWHASKVLRRLGVFSPEEGPEKDRELERMAAEATHKLEAERRAELKAIIRDGIVPQLSVSRDINGSVQDGDRVKALARSIERIEAAREARDRKWSNPTPEAERAAAAATGLADVLPPR